MFKDMADMKCLPCGGSKFVPYTFACILTEHEIYADSFACVECGRIEFYAKQYILDSYLDQIKKRELAEGKNAQIESQIASLQKSIDALNLIINDENQTVKTVRESKEKLIEIQKQIDSLKKEKSSTENVLRPSIP